MAHMKECSGSMVEYLTQGGGIAGTSLTGVSALGPRARHTNPCLVLFQHRKTRPNVTEKLLAGTKRIKSNRNSKQEIHRTDCFF